MFIVDIRNLVGCSIFNIVDVENVCTSRYGNSGDYTTNSKFLICVICRIF